MLARLRSHLTYANVGVTVALVLAGTGFAVAAIPGSDGVIHGCYQKKRGTLRVVKQGKRCKGSEKALAWNQQGRPGTDAQFNGVGAGGDLSGSYPNPALAAPEGWHEVGAPGEPGFQNSWHNAGFANTETVAFYRDREGVVHLRGAILPGVQTSGTAMFQLPPGYRPASGKYIFLAVACGCEVSDPQGNHVSPQTGEIQIYGSGFGASTDGKVTPDTGGPGAWFFDGVTFRAAS